MDYFNLIIFFVFLILTAVVVSGIIMTHKRKNDYTNIDAANYAIINPNIFDDNFNNDDDLIVGLDGE